MHGVGGTGSPDLPIAGEPVPPLPNPENVKDIQATDMKSIFRGYSEESVGVPLTSVEVEASSGLVQRKLDGGYGDEGSSADYVLARHSWNIEEA